MSKIILSLVFIFVSGSFALAQDKREGVISPADTVFRYQGIIPPLEFQYDFDEFYGKQSLFQLKDDLIFNNNSSTIWMRTELALSYPYLTGEETKIDNYLTSPLYQKYLEDSEFDMVRYVLGMAQMSAVAYMAYRHIKKYGFWK